MIKKASVCVLLTLTLSMALAAGPGNVIKKLAAPSACTTGLAYDGQALWTVDRDSDKLYRIDPADGKVLASFDARATFAPPWPGTAASFGPLIAPRTNCTVSTPRAAACNSAWR